MLTILDSIVNMIERGGGRGDSGEGSYMTTINFTWIMNQMFN
jgi:hypothetical protein